MDLVQLGANKKNNKHKTHKHFSDGPCRTIVPGTNRNPSQGQSKRNKMANSTEDGRFVPGTGPNLSQGWVPICPRDSFCLSRDTVPPKMFMFIVFCWQSADLLPPKSLFRPLLWRKNGCTRALPEIQGDEILNFGSEKCRGFLVANFLSVFARKNRLKVCHRKLHHILHCKKRNLSPGTHSGSILAQKMAPKKCGCNFCISSSPQIFFISPKGQKVLFFF